MIHGSQVIRFALLPIGQLSEEAQESRNKDYRRIREHNTRKSSRLNTTEDLVHMLLASSDPVISSYRHEYKKKITELSEEAKSLLKIDINEASEDEPTGNNSDSDSEFE